MRQSTEERLDALIVNAPFSPFDAGPPAGPAVLKAHCAAKNLVVHTVDLNIRYLHLFATGRRQTIPLVGDHSKDYLRISSARSHFVRACPLPTIDASRIPCCLQPVLSLPHDFEELQYAVEEMASSGFWVDFLKENLFDAFPQPVIIGFSLMGPAQVLVSSAAARLVRILWPGTIIVAGGSHITLKTTRLVQNRRYEEFFDLYFPSHCEHIFADFLRAVVTGGKKNACIKKGVISPGTDFIPVQELLPEEWRCPEFEMSELPLYAAERISLPVQLSRGCVYGRCSMCTYPAVEALQFRNIPQMARRMLAGLANYGVDRISFKDSLLPMQALKAVADAVMEIGGGLSWSATTKITARMDSELMRYLYKGGCRTLEVGVETIHIRHQELLDKRQPMKVIEETLGAALEAGISVVVNLIYGLPGETEREAVAQLEWFAGWKQRYPKLLCGSHNMVEINESSPFAADPRKYGIMLGHIGPWAFTYVWNAPMWRPGFLSRLQIADTE